MSAAARLTAGRREAIAAFYDARAYPHRRAVIRRTRGARGRRRSPTPARSRGCSSPPGTTSRLDERGFGWLTVVAVHDVWHQLDRNRRERPAGALTLPTEDDDELPEPAALTHDPLDRLLAAELHQQRLRRFATLKTRERRDLLLHAGGHTYDEIAGSPTAPTPPSTAASPKAAPSCDGCSARRDEPEAVRVLEGRAQNLFALSAGSPG